MEFWIVWSPSVIGIKYAQFFISCMLKKSDWIDLFDWSKTVLVLNRSNPVKISRFNWSNCKPVEPGSLIFDFFLSLETSFSLAQMPPASVFSWKNNYFIAKYFFIFLFLLVNRLHHFFLWKNDLFIFYLFIFEKQPVPSQNKTKNTEIFINPNQFSLAPKRPK